MFEVFRACPHAIVCMSAALGQIEFLETTTAFNRRSGIIAGSGLTEIGQILRHLLDNKKSCAKALPSRLLLRIPGAELAHGMECEVWSLSPSDKQFDVAIAALGNLFPQAHLTKYRVPEQTPNHLSVVIWVRIGQWAMLFGADLEELSDPQLGWSAILANTARPNGKATVFKIPHHGSITGHNPGVWDELLEPRPLSLLTPWNRGGGLPTKLDVDRISSLSSAAFISSKFVGGGVRRRSQVVEKQIRETVGRLRSAEYRTGRISLRSGEPSALRFWSVELERDACSLTDLT